MNGQKLIRRFRLATVDDWGMGSFQVLSTYSLTAFVTIQLNRKSLKKASPLERRFTRKSLPRRSSLKFSLRLRIKKRRPFILTSLWRVARSRNSSNRKRSPSKFMVRLCVGIFSCVVSYEFPSLFFDRPENWMWATATAHSVRLLVCGPNQEIDQSLNQSLLLRALNFNTQGKL